MRWYIITNMVFRVELDDRTIRKVEVHKDHFLELAGIITGKPIRPAEVPGPYDVERLSLKIDWLGLSNGSEDDLLPPS